MIQYSRIAISAKVIAAYLTNNAALPVFLAAWYKENPQMGSKDRKWVSELVYGYFRCYFLFNGEVDAAVTDRARVEMAVKGAFFLLNQEDKNLLQFLEPDWVPLMQEPLMDKVNFLTSLSLVAPGASIFPHLTLLSGQIDAITFSTAFLKQPLLFIRARDTHEQAVEQALLKRNIPFTRMGGHAFVLENGINLDFLKTPDFRGQAVIQDWASQQTGERFKPAKGSQWWDACAGAGGKSLLLTEYDKSISLFATDVRGSVLKNYVERLRETGFEQVETRVLDLTKDIGDVLSSKRFDGILIDAPCSGSGTWARSPEQMVRFSERNLAPLVAAQQRIFANVWPYLKAEGSLIYITCSVFKAENEDLVHEMTSRFSLKVHDEGYIKGYSERADTLYVARIGR